MTLVQEVPCVESGPAEFTPRPRRTWAPGKRRGGWEPHGLASGSQSPRGRAWRVGRAGFTARVAHVLVSDAFSTTRSSTE